MNKHNRFRNSLIFMNMKHKMIHRYYKTLIFITKPCPNINKIRIDAYINRIEEEPSICFMLVHPIRNMVKRRFLNILEAISKPFFPQFHNQLVQKRKQRILDMFPPDEEQSQNSPNQEDSNY